MAINFKHAFLLFLIDIACTEFLKYPHAWSNLEAWRDRIAADCMPFFPNVYIRLIVVDPELSVNRTHNIERNTDMRPPKSLCCRIRRIG